MRCTLGSTAQRLSGHHPQRCLTLPLASPTTTIHQRDAQLMLVTSVRRILSPSTSLSSFARSLLLPLCGSRLLQRDESLHPKALPHIKMMLR